LSIRTQRSSARLSAAAIVVALVASLFAFASPAGAAVTTERYAGVDRYQTAALAALDTYAAGAHQNIVLASGENFPDGLAAATLSGAANAPLLLTARNSLPASTANAIGTLGGNNPALVTVHVVGGTAAIAPAVRAQLTGLGYQLNEIGGATRYDTAANVAAAARSVAGDGLFQGLRTAIVVTGENFPDALSSGALAQAFNIPVILTTTASLSAQADAALTAGNIQQVYIIGGTAAVSASVASAIQAKGITVNRLSGANRFGTASALGNMLVAEEIAGGAGWDGQEFVLALGTNFPDALSAAQVAGENQAPIVLTSSPLPTDSCNILTAHAATDTKLFVMGGTAAISADTLTAAVACATLAAPTAEVTALDGRTSFTVQFSAQVINSTDLANYRLNNAALPGGSTVTAGPVGSNLVTVTLGAGTLVPNDLITVNPTPAAAGSIRTAAGAAVPLTNFTVVADTTRPAAILIRGFVGQTQAFVFFSEPVTNTAGNAAVTVTGVTTVAVTPLPAAPAQAWLITLSAGPAAGANVNVAAGAFADLATTPNTNLAASAIVVNDNVGPVLQSASYTTTPTAQASINLGSIEIDARATGIAAGALGNAWAVTSTTTAGTAIQVQVNTTTRRIQIGAPDPTSIPVADLVLALGNNAAFTANFTVTVTGAANVNVPAGPTNLTGGASNVRVTLQFNEQVRPNALGSTLAATDLTGVTAGTVDGPDAAAAAAPFLGQKVINYSTPADGPLPTFINLPANRVLDLATNGNLPVSMAVTAG
jgi:putative cell wall-binding protein